MEYLQRFLTEIAGEEEEEGREGGSLGGAAERWGTKMMIFFFKF